MQRYVLIQILLFVRTQRNKTNSNDSSGTSIAGIDDGWWVVIYLKNGKYTILALPGKRTNRTINKFVCIFGINMISL